VLRNNISFAGGAEDFFGFYVNHAFNSWNGSTISSADFLSLDSSANLGARKADGSLPDSDFLKLAPTSQLVNAGVSLGLPFNGAAPDVGAYEF
jgi:hypothetical protein